MCHCCCTNPSESAYARRWPICTSCFNMHKMFNRSHVVLTWAHFAVAESPKEKKDFRYSLAPYGKGVNCFRGSRRRQTEHSTSELQDRIPCGIVERLGQPEKDGSPKTSSRIATSVPLQSAIRFTAASLAYLFDSVSCTNVPVIPYSVPNDVHRRQSIYFWCYQER